MIGMQELLQEQDLPKLLIPAMEHFNASESGPPMAIMFRQILVDNPAQSQQFVQQFIAVRSECFMVR